MKKFLLLLVAIAIGLTTNAQAKLDKLVGYMTGSFTSAQQAKNDSDYFDISLKMTPVWETRTDAKWLYVEQAMSSKLDKPYRQRVYKVSYNKKTKTYESAVYTLPNPSRFINNPNSVNKLTPDSLTAREGCTVYLKAKGKKFVGGTQGNACASDLKGAAYASSKVTILSDRLVSWDQGFDTAGKQVWGATKGGYIFRRVP